VRRSAWVSFALAAALALSACGKRAEPRPPDGANEAYTYPKTYPNPDTVGPSGTQDLARPRSRGAPSGAGDISVFPEVRRKKTTVYGAPAQ